MIKFLRKKLDSQIKTLLKNSSWVIYSFIFGTLLAFVRSIIVARGLGAELFGIYAVITAFIGTLQAIFNLNLGAVVIKYGSTYKTENREDKIVSLVKLCFLASSVAIVISVLIVSGFVLFSYDTFIKAPGLGWFAILYSIAASGLFFTQISKGTLRLYFKFKSNSIVQMVIDFIEVLLIFLSLYFFPKNLNMFLLAILVSRLVNNVIPNIAAFRELIPELRIHLDASISLIKSQFKQIGYFAFHNSLAKTLQTLINTGDILIIGLLAGSPTQAGFYSVGKRVAFSILALTDPLVSSIYPQLCLLYAENKISEIKRMILKLSMMAAVPATVLVLIAFFFHEIIMKTLYGPEYIAAGETFYLLTGASLISAVFFWIHPLLQALDLLKIRLKIYLIGISAGLISAYFLVPLYGSKGMAFSLILVNLTMPYFLIHYSLKKLNESKIENKEI